MFAPLSKKMTWSLSICLISSLSVGCALQPYKIDIPQGTPLTQSQIEPIKVGMNDAQIRFLIGSPALVNPLTPNVWEYIYHYKAGTYAKKLDIPSVKSQKLTLTFNDKNEVIKIEGANTIPVSQPILPVSKDTSFDLM